MTGTIKINPDICGNKQSAEKKENGERKASNPRKHISDSVSAKECALADMADDDVPMPYNLGENIEDDEDAA